jgi:4-hydroxybenzoate polyprenyltransferase
MPLVVLYPLMKRYTYFPQAVLGLAMNWGALLGWAEVCGGSGNSLSSVVMSAALPLYVGGVCWTLVYDTIYGYQDCDDDQRLGLKSTSLYLGETPRLPLTVLGAGMIAGLVWSGHSVGLTYPFYLGMAASSAHLAWQITTLNIQDKHNLWTRFHSNQYLGLLVTMSIVAGHIVIA